MQIQRWILETLARTLDSVGQLAQNAQQLAASRDSGGDPWLAAVLSKLRVPEGDASRLAMAHTLAADVRSAFDALSRAGFATGGLTSRVSSALARITGLEHANLVAKQELDDRIEMITEVRSRLGAQPGEDVLGAARRVVQQAVSSYPSAWLADDATPSAWHTEIGGLPGETMLTAIKRVVTAQRHADATLERLEKLLENVEGAGIVGKVERMIVELATRKDVGSERAREANNQLVELRNLFRVYVMRDDRADGSARAIGDVLGKIARTLRHIPGNTLAEQVDDLVAANMKQQRSRHEVMVERDALATKLAAAEARIAELEAGR